MSTFFTFVLLLNKLIILCFSLDQDIPPYFEDIEPFHELTPESLQPLAEEDKQKYFLFTETHRVPDPEKFTFLQYPLSFFAMGINSGKLKSAVLILDDENNGKKMYKDLVAYNGDPDFVLNMNGEAETTASTRESLQFKTSTWQMGRSSMSYSLHPIEADTPGKLLTRIHLRIIR